MNLQTVVLRIKPYIQPFERRLAVDELLRIAHVTEVRCADDPATFSVRTAVPLHKLRSRLAYWESILAPHSLIMEQVLREATIAIARNGIPLEELHQVLPFNGAPALPNRRCLRYGPHGMHEYRGKFFPQLVRALLNSTGVEADAVVADTMCGSGTTVVEAASLGCTAIGNDLNPLSVLIARAKAGSLRCRPAHLVSAYHQLRSALAATRRQCKPVWLSQLGAEDRTYLDRWFSQRVLSELDQIAGAVQSIDNRTHRDVMWVSLSNIIRQVSLQKEDDLRVRREPKNDRDLQPLASFLKEAHRTVKALVAFQLQSRSAGLGNSFVHQGDARSPHVLLKRWAGRVDAIVTSPPYAMALPYLDTDRLSLTFLGLLNRREQRRLDDEMVGNREVTERKRLALFAQYQSARRFLPEAVVQLVDRVHALNDGADVGFRRRNMSALLPKYFLDMRAVFKSMRLLMRKGASAFVVVGSNHTYAGGEKVTIPTASLLAEVAQSCGIEPKDRISMEMLVSRDIFRRNASDAEEIVVLKRRQ